MTRILAQAERKLAGTFSAQAGARGGELERVTLGRSVNRARHELGARGEELHGTPFRQDLIGLCGGRVILAKGALLLNVERAEQTTWRSSRSRS